MRGKAEEGRRRQQGCVGHRKASAAPALLVCREQAPSGRADKAGAAAHEGPKTRVQGTAAPRS